MLATATGKGWKRIVPVIGVLFVLTLLGLQLYQRHGSSRSTSSLPLSHFFPIPQEDSKIDMSMTHTELYSPSTPDKTFFRLDFGGRLAMNPSIIPHPEQPNTWIITAQLRKPAEQHRTSVWFAELVCPAVFRDGGRTLTCLEPPLILPIAATVGDRNNCVGDLSYFTLNIGPHDARVFYGPEAPYTIYGSNSQLTCFGQWIQDFRPLVDWKGDQDLFLDHGFRQATELQRPRPYGAVEKNWFLFWDATGQAYVHYDVAPNRVFARLESDGSVGPDLAPLAVTTDQQCLSRHLPQLQDPGFESIHQATNSLTLTLCLRSDPQCQATDINTYILTIFQHKTFYSFHSVYEPYAMLFRRSAPFDLYGISTKPFWIAGRGTPGHGRKPATLTAEESAAWNQTEMLYVTSISWKAQGQNYHGYLDDRLFIAFGREDEDTAGIDIVAGDLLQDLGLCAM
ncbi:hypothetical protein BDV28DRAFT_133628 [Aspergillus coremiiformis]|uniref:Uncharacterized protein n=1 Tax=Aspergillus coremiiformis TaxID=138285 RepID=A0A5N6Z8Y7_9EURO|nr:hypothetical protein BDV28DRAFT_133628 [Aspergillus coremiiformis]